MNEHLLIASAPLIYFLNSAPDKSTQLFWRFNEVAKCVCACVCVLRVASNVGSKILN